MTPIVAFAHCVCGIKLPLLSSQLPASNSSVELSLLPSSLFLSLFLSLSFTLSSQLFTSVLLVYLAPSALILQLPLLSSPSCENKPALLSSSCTVRKDGRKASFFGRELWFKKWGDEMIPAAKENQRPKRGKWTDTYGTQAWLTLHDCFSMPESFLSCHLS